MSKKKKSTEKRRLVEELHGPMRKNFPWKRVIVQEYDLWQTDIVKMHSYSQRLPYLSIIDVLSKHAWAAQEWK